MPIVYEIKNKINNKKYIGQTTRTLKERWKSHCSAAKNNSKFRFHSAIRKYGTENWTLRVLYEDDNIKNVKNKEEKLISEYDTMNMGYNARPGNTGGWIVKNKEQWLKNLKPVNGENNPNYSGISNRDFEKYLTECSVIFSYIPDFKTFSEWCFETHNILLPKSMNGLYRGSYMKFVDIVSKRTGLQFRKYKMTREHKLKLSKSIIGRHWYNDGKNEKQLFECPSGWERGRIK